MKTILFTLVSAFLLIAIPNASPAAPLKTYVTEFGVSGSPNRDELKGTLQGLLASRLNPDQVQLVESQDKAELLVAGSYSLFGKSFSLDVMLKSMGSGLIRKVFEQGDGQDDLLPAIGRLAQKIDRELAKSAFTPAVAPAPVVAPAPRPAQTYTVPVPATVAPSGSSKAAPPVVIPADGYVVRSESGSQDVPGSWTSAPLEGIFSCLATGRTLPSGEMEIFLANDQAVRYYTRGADLKQIAEVTIPEPGKILALDSADLDGDGVPELYVTVIDRGALSSLVYLVKGNGLEKIAGNLPWFFRGIGPDLKSRVVYTQELSTGGKFYPQVAELVKTGSVFSTTNPRKLPRSGYVFNFNRLGGTAADPYVVLNEDGRLVVSSPDDTELWISNDKYGGSERSFRIESHEKMRTTGDQYFLTFLEQRITITPQGELLVPHNEGFLTIGNNRSYSKYSLHAFTWNGSSLKEKWHTRPNQSYLADYAYDPASRELILLEVVKKAGLFGKGRSVISINKID